MFYTVKKICKICGKKRQLWLPEFYRNFFLAMFLHNLDLQLLSFL